MKLLKAVDAVMLRYSWLATWTLLAALIIVVIQAIDRRPPFAVMHVFPAEARPGDTITIHAEVWRDSERRCAVDMARSVFDTRGARFDLPVAAFTPTSIGPMRSDTTPGRMAVSFVVPPDAASGPADLVSAMEFRCNQVQQLWPIKSKSRVQFTILP